LRSISSYGAYERDNLNRLMRAIIAILNCSDYQESEVKYMEIRREYIVISQKDFTFTVIIQDKSKSNPMQFSSKHGFGSIDRKQLQKVLLVISKVLCACPDEIYNKVVNKEFETEPDYMYLYTSDISVQISISKRNVYSFAVDLRRQMEARKKSSTEVTDVAKSCTSVTRALFGIREPIQSNSFISYY
jgi:hypothetical protein